MRRSAWIERPLAEIAEVVAMGPFGSSIKVETFVSSPGVPVISGQHLHGARLNSSSGFSYITAEHADVLNRSNVFRGDVIFTHAGNIKNVAFIPQDAEFDRYVVSQRQFFVRPKRDIILPDFLTYFFLSPLGQHRLLANSVQTGVPSIAQPVTYIRSVEVPVPSMAEQQAITGLLGSIDDKIESNCRISSLSTDLAIATLSGQGHLLRVGDVAEISKGLSYKGAGLSKKNDSHSIPLFSLSSFTREGQLSPSNLKFYSGEFKSKHELQPWELLIANTDLTPGREILGRGIIIPEKYSGAIHTHHTTAVRFNSNSNFALLLWAQLQTPAFRNRAEGFATGTTVAALPPEAILDFHMTVPLDAEIRIEEAKKLLRMSWQVAEENERLAKIRDALLPALLSGRINLSKLVA